ncbi:hypothetical protein [Streptomyces xiamenensis]|uniref:hypothetical protein n=1 Tax=Streptomyces xiamenensis TaxID=408015 RepID=UPI0035E1C618
MEKRRGRPTVGPKVETRLSGEALRAVDEMARRMNTDRAKVLRSLIIRGLDDGPQNGRDLHDEDIERIADRLDRDGFSGAEVYTDGTTYWVVCKETDQIWGSATAPAAAALLMASLLLDYEQFTRADTFPGSGDPSLAYPDLVAAGREIAADPDDLASELEPAARRIASARNT